VLHPGPNFNISDSVSRQEPFYEIGSLAWIDPGSEVEGSSTNDFIPVPTGYTFKGVVDGNVAIVFGAR
jgi:hypothetical protein